MPPAPRPVGQVTSRSTTVARPRWRRPRVEKVRHRGQQSAVGAQVHDFRAARAQRRIDLRGLLCGGARETALASGRRRYRPSAAPRSPGLRTSRRRCRAGPPRADLAGARRSPRGDVASERKRSAQPSGTRKSVTSTTMDARRTRRGRDGEHAGQVRRAVTRCGAARRASGPRCAPRARDRRRAARCRRSFSANRIRPTRLPR